MFDAPEAVLDAVNGGFSACRIMVVGDLILDRYLWGQVERISPEAPVPVVHLQRETETAGGAANVARNLATMGLNVTVVGFTGDDPGRSALLRELALDCVNTDTVFIAEGRHTTIKTRVICHHQQMLRIDQEQTGSISGRDSELVLQAVATRLPGIHCLVLSDYKKGVLGPDLCVELIRAARAEGVPVLVDPKGHDFSHYSGASVITPNRAELALATGSSAGDLDALLAASQALRESLDLAFLVLTLGEKGMAVVEPDGIHHIPAIAREVFDVSGAGDTVIATFAAGLATRLGRLDTAHLANLAAGVVVGKMGTAAITAKELLSAISGEFALEQAGKICPWAEARERVRRWKSAGERVVFTNGCFDLLHVGHVTYLERARQFGHRLVVGLNTDRSVRALKGPARPVIREDERARVLAALASVDAVVLFDEDTPLALIESLQPDVLAKGADYKEEEVIGAREVKSWGGQVVLVPLVENKSTTGIIRRMGVSDVPTPPP